MALTTSPFLLKNLSLTLVKTAEVAGVAEEYRCQLTAATLTPSTGGGGGGSTLETFCDSYSSTGASTATWTLDLSGFQAYKDVTDLSILLFNDEGENYTYTLMPEGPAPISATNPGFTGEVTLIPTTIGGTANQYATFTVSLPTVGKPTMITAPPVFA
jgi:hypothetical protein